MMENSYQAGEQVKTLVLGLGKTGLSVVRYLTAHGERVAVVDSREMPPALAAMKEAFSDVAVFLGGFDEALFEGAGRLVVSPGISLDTPQIQRAIDRGAEVIGDIELFASETNDSAASVVAITGSNGKSTVTTLLGEMARQSGRNVRIGGNLGEPALDLLDDDVDLYVLELSSFQLESTRTLKTAVATVLNISADHMDRYRDLDHYSETKAGIFRHAGHAVVNLDDAAVSAMWVPADVTGFTLNAPANDQSYGLRLVDNETWICRGHRPLIATSRLRIRGQHNIANAMAALALGAVIGLDRNAMLKALAEFPGLEHRTQFVRELNQVSWYNDSKGTNVGACIAALQGLDQGDQSRTVLIAGGDCKDADLTGLTSVLESYARSVVAMGQDASMIMGIAPAALKVRMATDMSEAVGLAASEAKPGDRVLLSPACASLDMYRDYSHRGQDFMQAVDALVGRQD